MEIMTAKELAELLKISLPTLYKMVNSGEIPGFKVANEWRFEREEIQAWIEGLSRGNREAVLDSKPETPARAGGKRRSKT